MHCRDDYAKISFTELVRFPSRNLCDELVFAVGFNFSRRFCCCLIQFIYINLQNHDFGVGIPTVALHVRGLQDRVKL